MKSGIYKKRYSPTLTALPRRYGSNKTETPRTTPTRARIPPLIGATHLHCSAPMRNSFLHIRTALRSLLARMKNDPWVKESIRLLMMRQNWQKAKKCVCRYVVLTLREKSRIAICRKKIRRFTTRGLRKPHGLRRVSRALPFATRLFDCPGCHRTVIRTNVLPTESMLKGAHSAKDLVPSDPRRKPRAMAYTFFHTLSPAQP